MIPRAKFYCSEKKEQASVGQAEKMISVTLCPVTGGSEENEKFYKYTPSGKIELGILNPVAAAQFEAGKVYYVDFKKLLQRAAGENPSALSHALFKGSGSN